MGVYGGEKEDHFKEETQERIPVVQVGVAPEEKEESDKAPVMRGHGLVWGQGLCLGLGCNSLKIMQKSMDIIQWIILNECWFLSKTVTMKVVFRMTIFGSFYRNDLVGILCWMDL